MTWVKKTRVSDARNCGMKKGAGGLPKKESHEKHGQGHLQDAGRPDMRSGAHASDVWSFSEEEPPPPASTH